MGYQIMLNKITVKFFCNLKFLFSYYKREDLSILIFFLKLSKSVDMDSLESLIALHDKLFYLSYV